MIKRFTILLFTCISFQAFAQDPEFSQFYSAPLYLNPAFAGSARCPRIAMNYRNQWPALNKTFITYAASYDQHVDAVSGGLGLLIMNDKAGEGTLAKTDIAGMYAFALNLSRDFTVRLGLQANYVQEHVDWDKLTFGDEIDPRFGYIYQTQEIRPNESHSFVDFSTGILAYTSRIYGGVAVNHLTEPDQAFIVEGSSPLPMKITGHLGAMLPLGEARGSYKLDYDVGTYLSPNILYQQQRAFNQINVGVYILHSPIIGGLWYRGYLDKALKGDSFIALLGLQKGVIKFGYSYDITISKLTNNVTAGSHEISFGMQFECHPKKKRFKTIRCPTF